MQKQKIQTKNNRLLQNDDLEALLARAAGTLIDVFFEINTPAYCLTQTPHDEPNK